MIRTAGRITLGIALPVSQPMQEPLRKLVPGFTKEPTGLPPRKGSYGIDAPYLLPVLGLLLVANVANGVASGSVWPFLARFDLVRRKMTQDRITAMQPQGDRKGVEFPWQPTNAGNMTACG